MQKRIVYTTNRLVQAGASTCSTKKKKTQRLRRILVLLPRYQVQLGSLKILDHYSTVCATSTSIENNRLILSQRGSYTKDDMHDSE